jgi:hypothetical protein
VGVPFDGGGIVLGPLIALLMIGALALVLKWTFTGVPDDKFPAERLDPDYAGTEAGRPEPGRPDQPPRMVAEARPADSRPRPHRAGGAQRTTGDRTGTDTDDYGLLKVVAVVDTAAAADEVRDLLAAAGIRTTVAAGAGGRTRVLVFGSELARAYDVLNS